MRAAGLKFESWSRDPSRRAGISLWRAARGCDIGAPDSRELIWDSATKRKAILCTSAQKWKCKSQISTTVGIANTNWQSSQDVPAARRANAENRARPCFQWPALDGECLETVSAKRPTFS